MINNKLSIGIALFRDDRSANFAIQSAMAQSDNCNEIIISDNNVERCSNLVDDWRKDSRVKYINGNGNIGMYKSFVRAYDNSKNRYFCWLSDDDFLHPILADAVTECILSNFDQDVLAWAGLSTVHSNNHCSRLTGRIYPSFTSTKPINRLRDVAFFGQWNYPFYSVLDKNKVSIETLRKFCDWPASVDGMDWAWTYSLALRGKIKVVPEQMYFYNISNWENADGASKKHINFTKFIRTEFHGEDKLINELTKLNRALLYMTFTFSDYIDHVKTNNNASCGNDVNDLMELWCHNILENIVRLRPLTLPATKKYDNFLSSHNLREFIYNLADFYDQYLVNSSVGHFVRTIFSAEVCNDQMKILETHILKIKKRSFSIRNLQTKNLRLFFYIFLHVIRDKIVFLPKNK
jgi:glycosyltransferase involved in cell wall biosynthesis